jgi:PAS domain S-box-containing protein
MLPVHPRVLFGVETQLLEHVHAAVLVIDLAGGVLYANPFCEVLYGRSPDDLVGSNCIDLAIDPVSPELAREIGTALEEDHTWEGDFSVRTKSGDELEVHTVNSPMLDTDGSLVGVVSLAFDVTQQHREAEQQRREEERQRFFAETSALLTWSLDYSEIFQRLAQLSVPFLADLCIIDVEEGGTVRRLAAAHANPELQELVDRLGSEFPPDPRGVHPAVDVLRSARSRFSTDMTEEFLRATTRNETHYETVRKLGFTSYMVVPLVARGRVLGALSLVASGSGRRFGDEDVELAEEFGRRAALAIDNARLYARQLHIARALQASLLPPTLPSIAELDVATRYSAAAEETDVGGDFYDVIEARDDAWWLVVGDVTGKGPEAAAVAGLARHTLRAGALHEGSPKSLLRLLNATLRGELGDANSSCTVACAYVRPTSRGLRATLACAGHPPPIVVGRDGRARPSVARGTLLGVFDKPRLETESVQLSAGRTLVFYTDGVTEARSSSGDFFGEDRLAELVAQRAGSAAELADRMVDAVNAFDGGAHRDDFAVLVVRSRAS